MSKAKQRAVEAKQLSDEKTFLAFSDEILSGAKKVFLNASSTIEAIAQAHERVRAIQTFNDAIQARLDDALIEEKREGQHRGND